ncbi:hypothetical protein CMQ_6134 [Grosmannia clavigera kw1407]|uniref:Uncharacterized protein n=1 Tax=Grosmannia clavigera (strain kw1407 / UAMH 11150) TaxID=655863 RepID=F0XLN8_GROCL|nr:uncharacterized protein CMQ_6134 [Grosmannia clavigera kw1407]EFX01192.1 hypothetical protein CMQ_6134 [Grosmannia clavigera kw1407]
MTEAENFDDELFADLYADDEPAAPKVDSGLAPSTTAAATNFAAAPVSAFAAAVEPMSRQYDNGGNEPNGGDYDGAREEYDDDDDEVDFNLGNGSSSNNNNNGGGNMNSNMNSGGGGGQSHMESTPPVSSSNPYHGGGGSGAPFSRGPNSKEDGQGSRVGGRQMKIMQRPTQPPSREKYKASRQKSHSESQKEKKNEILQHSRAGEAREPQGSFAQADSG